MTEIKIISKIVSATPVTRTETVKITEDETISELLHWVDVTLSAYAHACAKIEDKGSVYVISNGRSNGSN